MLHLLNTCNGMHSNVHTMYIHTDCVLHLYTYTYFKLLPLDYIITFYQTVVIATFPSRSHNTNIDFLMAISS